jgi:hypothetical protein
MRILKSMGSTWEFAKAKREMAVSAVGRTRRPMARRGISCSKQRVRQSREPQKVHYMQWGFVDAAQNRPAWHALLKQDRLSEQASKKIRISA